MATAKTASRKPAAKKKAASSKGILAQAKDAIVEAYHTVVDGATTGAADGIAAAIGEKMGSGDPAKAAETGKPVRGNGTSATSTKAKSKPAASGGKSASSAKSKTASAAKSSGNGGAKKTAAKSKPSGTGTAKKAAAKSSAPKAKSAKPAAKSSGSKRGAASAK